MGYWRQEVKSGAQAGPVATRHLSSEAQSEANRARGDNRPFRAVWMPKGMSDGFITVRVSTWMQHVDPALREFYGDEGGYA